MKNLKKSNGKIRDLLDKLWWLGKTHKKPTGFWALCALSYLYSCASKSARFFQKIQQIKSKLPVIVVGNLTVGGNGKTPAIIALVNWLKNEGYKVGVVSRGYPINPKNILLVQENSQANVVGDEPLLIYRKTGVPVVVCKNRKKAIRSIEALDVQIILSDDGLQNESFYHDLELVLVDGKRGFGNEHLLPAGPLRESISRLKKVAFVVEKRMEKRNGKTRPTLWPYQLILRAGEAIRVQDWRNTRHSPHSAIRPTDTSKRVIAELRQRPLLAVTAIANPQGFFDTLTESGLIFETLSLPDHAAITPEILAPYANYQIIMTEKDAVKWNAPTTPSNLWCLTLEEKFSENFKIDLRTALSQLPTRKHNSSFVASPSLETKK